MYADLFIYTHTPHKVSLKTWNNNKNFVMWLGKEYKFL